MNKPPPPLSGMAIATGSVTMDRLSDTHKSWGFVKLNVVVELSIAVVHAAVVHAAVVHAAVVHAAVVHAAVVHAAVVHAAVVVIIFLYNRRCQDCIVRCLNRHIARDFRQVSRPFRPRYMLIFIR